MSNPPAVRVPELDASLSAALTPWRKRLAVHIRGKRLLAVAIGRLQHLITTALIADPDFPARDQRHQLGHVEPDGTRRHGLTTT